MNKAGRNSSGVITVLSKGVKNKSSQIPLFYPSRWNKKLSVVSSIFRNKAKLYYLSKYITGSMSLRPGIDGIEIGQFVFCSNLPKNFWKYQTVGHLVMLRFLSNFTIFSNVFFNGIKKYALANGTFCQLLEFFYDFNFGRITLPTLQVKVISGWNFVMLGRNSQIDHKYKIPGKAGFNKVLGKKSKVRGVARNPVDHPHGGRTKTNKPEVSIWGWIAKRNK